jgi:hypothetical protein
MALIVLIAIPFFSLFGLSNAECSIFGCSERVRSEQETHRALAVFFSSNSWSSRQLITRLRDDGLTDEFLAALKKGCDGCYSFVGGKRPRFERESWYVAAPIAKGRGAILKIECETSVSLEYVI